MRDVGGRSPPQGGHPHLSQNPKAWVPVIWVTGTVLAAGVGSRVR
jgi:hypothetical protein